MQMRIYVYRWMLGYVYVCILHKWYSHAPQPCAPLLFRKMLNSAQLNET